VSLANFLSRPIEISRFEWQVAASGGGGFTPLRIQPWREFLTNPAIRDKVHNYRLLRGKLCVKFVINGNPFVYGLACAYYHPFGSGDALSLADPLTTDNNQYMNCLISPDSGPVDYTNLDFRDMIIHTQKPHIWLNPTMSLGGKMELPFVWPYNFLDLTATEAKYIGNIFVVCTNSLKTVTGQAVGVDVTVFAWMEDVELHVTTSVGVAAQSGTSSGAGDEYGTGPVSKLANAVAKASMSVSDVPVIGPYARASSMVAAGVGRLAQLFGFSRPAIIQDISPYKPVYYGNISNTDAGDSTNKLTLDSKQEVTIDPRVAGLSSVDGMTITSIAAHESLIGTFNWTYLDAPNHGLWATRVNPRIWNTDITSAVRRSGQQYAASSTFVASIPFRYWRGTMRYRFMIVASKFHRGRIRIVWDPAFIKAAVDSTGARFPVFNITYNIVVDIAEVRDFTVDVGWGQEQPYLYCGYQPQRESKGVCPIVVEQMSSLPLQQEKFCNGILGVFVVNKLVANVGAGSLDSISVNVLASCPDLEVMEPQQQNIANISFGPGNTTLPTSDGNRFSFARAQSGIDEGDACDAFGPDGTKCGPSFMLGPAPTSATNSLPTVFFGDPVISIRNLLKRYCFYATYTMFIKGFATSATRAFHSFKLTLPDFPLNKGIMSSPVTDITVCKNGMVIILAKPSGTTARYQAYNYCNTTYLSFFHAAYVGRRGGIRWKYGVSSQGGMHSVLAVERGASSGEAGVYRARAAESSMVPNSLAVLSTMCVPYSGNGAAITATGQNPVVEAEMPYYTRRRFMRNNEYDTLANNELMHKVQLSINDHHNTDYVPYLESWCAAADDFCLLWYIGLPVFTYTDLWQVYPAPSSSVNGLFNRHNATFTFGSGN